MEVVCNNCNKLFNKRKSRVDNINSNNYNHYCSRKCQALGLSKKIQVDCFICKNKILKRKQDIDKSKSGYVFCSSSCAAKYNNTLKIGEKHPNYKGNNYIKKAFDNYPHLCNKCGNSEEAVLQVHHLDGNRKNNEIINLEILCANCHSIKHRKRL